MPTCGLRKAQRSLMLKTICTLAASRQFPTCVKHSEAEDQIFIGGQVTRRATMAHHTTVTVVTGATGCCAAEIVSQLLQKVI